MRLHTGGTRPAHGTRIMKKLGTLLTLVAIAFAAPACSSKKKDPADSKMAKLCVEATDQLSRDAEEGEGGVRCSDVRRPLVRGR